MEIETRMSAGVRTKLIRSSITGMSVERRGKSSVVGMISIAVPTAINRATVTHIDI
jgi:hypothetical protein